jgi:hypothetical protein
MLKPYIQNRPKGHWKWGRRCNIVVVKCPINEAPDLRRRGHALIKIFAKDADRRYLGLKSRAGVAIRKAHRYCVEHDRLTYLLLYGKDG